MDYILKSNDEIIVINDYIENDPLSENNLEKALDLVNEFRLSCPQKSIWIYSGYEWSHIFDDSYYSQTAENLLIWRSKRQEIIKMCDIMVDGKYINSQRDISLRWRGSSNQKVIDIKKSLQQNKVVLYCD